MDNVVEIYFDKELSDITFDTAALAEWKKNCEELGLSEQLSLVSGKDSPIPYPHMNTTINRVCETLCGCKIEFNKYSKTPIPLDVLKQIKFSVNEKHFQKIEIWYDDKSPDPFVVGRTCKWYGYNDNKKRTKDCDTREEAIALSKEGSSIYETDVNHYLIARWGDVKRDFTELKEMATNRFIDMYSNNLSKDIKVLQDKLSLIKENSVQYFNGDISLSKATTTSEW